MSTRIEAVARGARLCTIAFSHAMRWLVHTALVRARFRKTDPCAFGSHLAHMFEHMGPTFVKLGQLLSARPDLIAPQTAFELARLRASGSPVPAAAIVRVIESSLGAPVETLFAEFDRQPIATGSIAQVHRAALDGGKAVAVKVRKPRVAEQIDADFAFLDIAGRILERIPGLHSVPITDVVGELREALAAQVSLSREAQNNLRFAANFAADPAVIVPKLVPQRCSDDVLTMELIEGLVPVRDLQFEARERGDAARAGLRMLYRMIFDYGFAHADLHPGNVFFRKGPEVVIVDLGLVATLDNAGIEAFRRFFLAMATNDGKTCARVVVETASSTPPRFDPAEFASAMNEMVDRFAGRRVKEFEVSRFARELFALQRRFQVRGSTAFTMIIVSLFVFEGIVKTLDPELDFQLEASRFLLSPRAGAGMGLAERTKVFAAMRTELSL